ncbi:RNHCP domain-containing protein [Stackebrandtia endophytica]|uniref:RNHCP domain-containing protein n=1 Tax=Stackebrandtia endophytica TaxID=1496996 RepID=A0A543B208_9ACTN|nr:RNHCP domain-containing protein [Stackebrandtia endophytica]TQL78760.1 RNHCP domain-containing protein [Stackebrandtia endophytica]
MSRRNENTGFRCLNCDARVVALTNGGYRNHCPFCLRSRHVDIRPGDRAADCGGLMDPVGWRHKTGKDWQIEFECRDCGTRSVNRVARGMTQPDDLLLLTHL